MTRFVLGRIVTQMEWQGHLAFDLRLLFVDDHCRRVGQGHVLQAHAQDGGGGQGAALQVKDFAVEAGLRSRLHGLTGA